MLGQCRLGVEFRKIGAGRSPSDVVMSWLRLQTHLECIPHPCHMYTQCFSTLICRGWAYGCTLTLLRLCRSGGEFWIIGVGRSLSNAGMSWLRLQTHLESTPHPCHMYTKCFSTLICCGWAYGSALTLLHLCRSGVDLRKIGLSPSPSDVVLSWLRLQTHLECIPHPFHMYTQRFSTLICCGWAYNLPLHCSTFAGQGWILGKLGQGRA